MYDPCAPLFVVGEEERKTLINIIKLCERRHDLRKKEEHLYPVMGPAQFGALFRPYP